MQPDGHRPVVEAVFVLDTTGSMGGLIQAAKDKIWPIASTMAAGEPAPLIRMGLVAYRDRGDEYLTRVVDLTPDLDTIHTAVSRLQANGGGDTPESVNLALQEAVNAVSWSPDGGVYRVIFLVGDAPPHLDDQEDVKYPQTLAVARKRGIRVNAIQCGGAADTRAVWQEIAQLGQGAFFEVESDGATVAIATPYDDRLARLSAELDGTRLYYGSESERAQRAERLSDSAAVRDAAPAPVLARRATFAASASGRAALRGDNELVDDIASGRKRLDAIETGDLPEPLQALSRDDQRETIDALAERRAQVVRQIEETSAARSDYLRRKVAEAGGASSSLDRKLFDTVREQARGIGLEYADDAAAY